MRPGEFTEQPLGTYGELIHEQAQRRPGHPALVQEGCHVAFAELDAMMDRVAAALQREGIRAKEAVAICAATSIEYAVVFLGALRAGVAVAPLAPSSTAQSLAGMVANADARLMFIDTATPRQLESVRAQIGARFIALDDAIGSEPFSQWLAPVGTTPIAVHILPDWPFNIIYSSGTTGTPKGIVRPLHPRRPRIPGQTGYRRQAGRRPRHAPDRRGRPRSRARRDWRNG